ncbi:hypothetical protein R0290_23165 [Burkholderia semiarida]|uniref:hypothetical protein n=1 Tax=Burkholderia TaxID=32008 RepID=UPI00265D8D05|nr:hypothetical protein [Burkholderia sp. AU44665]MDN7700107.1 hypothetical protein [Burkholderia sp. AU44665]
MTQPSCSRHGCDEREAEHEVCRWPSVPAACMPVAIAASIAGGAVQLFIPDRKLHHPVIRLALTAALIVPLFAGCAPTRSDTATTAAAVGRKPVPSGLMPGEQVDYGGHRCGNPNLYVKTHPCVYPQRNSVR